MNKTLLCIFCLFQLLAFSQNEIAPNRHMKLAKEHLINGEFERSIISYDKAYKELKEKPVSKNKVIIQNNKGVAFWKLGNYEAAIKSYKSALSFAIDLKNDTLISQSRYNLGLNYKSLGLFEIATKEFLLAIKVFEKLKKEKQVASVFDALGNIHTEMDEYELAEMYHLSALKVYKKMSDQTGEASVYHNLSQVYLDSNEFKKAQFYLSKAKNLKLKLGLSMAANYARFGSYFMLTNKLDSAEYYYKLSLDERLKGNNPSKLATAYLHMGSLNISKSNFKAADQYLQMAFQIADSKKMNQVCIDILVSQVQLADSIGQFKKATRLQEKIMFLTNQVLGEKSRKEVARFNIEYKTLEKDQEIGRKSNELSINKLERDTLKFRNKTLLLFAALFLVFILISLWFNRKLKKQQNILTERNELIDNLHKELSHRMKNYFEMFGGMIRYDERNMKDEKAIKLLKKYGNRVDAMSQIQHYLLFDKELSEEVQLDSYLSNLLSTIEIVLNDASKKVQITSDFAKTRCSYNIALRLGLVMNELISNSFEHGFVAIENPKLVISLGLNLKTITLLIEDNGVGYTNDQQSNGNSIGISLMKMLLKNIDGEIEHSNSPTGSGTRAIINVPK